MSQKMMVAFVVLVLMSSSVWAQKSKTTSKKKTSAAKELSVAEKMTYARTNKHWGPGTYYCFAPGVPNVKMVVNQITAMRDLTGISREDCISELTRQGFKAVPSKEIQNGTENPKTRTIFIFIRRTKVLLYARILSICIIASLPAQCLMLRTI